MQGAVANRIQYKFDAQIFMQAAVLKFGESEVTVILICNYNRKQMQGIRCF